MAYQSNIPQAGDNISKSQGDILANFQYLGSTAGNTSPKGFYTLPNGLIVNWGKTAIPNMSSGQFTDTFSQPYSTTFFSMVYSVQGPSSANAPVTCIDTAPGPSLTGFQIRFSSNNNAGSGNIFWIAIGI